MMLFKVAFAILLAGASANLDVTLCSDTRCKEAPLGTFKLDSTSGCRTDFAGKALGLKVEPSALDANLNQTVRFYRSTDCFGHCGSGHLVSEFRDGFQSLSGFTPKPIMQSFELVELDSKGHYPPHGYCGIRHGDAQFFRGRTWKWQQIGENTFREIPIEDWDDALHVQQTSDDYDMHGSVDSMGEVKMQQVAAGAWLGVPLGEWDEDVHVRKEGVLAMDDEWLE